jgi:hypothetical protein
MQTIISSQLWLLQNAQGVSSMACWRGAIAWHAASFIPAAVASSGLTEDLPTGPCLCAVSWSREIFQVAAMKYQLPSDPDVYVDVVDDEDVSLMLDEWREASAAAAPGTNPSRLHIFVQWCASAWLASSSIGDHQC